MARDADEAEALERLIAFRESLGLEVERLRPSQARRAEPALAPTVRLALDVAGDHSIDPRRLVAALRRGGRGAPRPRDARCCAEGGRVTGVELEDGAALAAGAVVLAAGVARRGGSALPEEARVPVRPGQGPGAAAARPDAAPGLVERTIRGEQAYLVPRGDGRYVLGATMEERGWDTAPTAGGVYELIRDMSEVVPGVLELEIEELVGGPAPGHARQPAGDRPRRARGPRVGRRATTATASCSRPSPPSSSRARWPASRCPDWARPADPARFAGVPA